MKRKQLIEALDKLLPAVANSPLSAEMGTFRFAGDTLRATDGLTMIQVKLPESTGLDCCIPAPKFRKLLDTLSGDEINIEQDGDDVKVKAGKVRAKYKALIEPGLLDNLDFEVNDWKPMDKPLIRAIKLARFAASLDASRGPLCGILLDTGGVLASDGFRIAHAKPLEATLAGDPFVLTLDLAAQVDKYSDKITGWARKDDIIYFRIGDDTIVAGKRVVGQYPDALEFLEQAKDLADQVVFPEATRESLSRHLEQQADVPELDRDVEIKLAGNELTISSGSTGYSLEETLELDGEVGSKIRFKIHPRFLSDILGRSRRMKYDSEAKFILFEADVDDVEFSYLATVERLK